MAAQYKTRDGRAKETKLRVMVDTCFWVTMAGLDLLPMNPSRKEVQDKNDRMNEAERAFNFILKNSDRMEIVATRFTHGELNRTLEKIMHQACDEYRYSDERMSLLKERARELERVVIETGHFRDLDSWSFIRTHPELPIPPTPDPDSPGGMRRNPDRHWFAISEIMNVIKGGMDKTLILSFDDHVLSVGQYKETRAVSPKDFRSVAEFILYTNEVEPDSAQRQRAAGRPVGGRYELLEPLFPEEAIYSDPARTPSGQQEKALEWRGEAEKDNRCMEPGL